jgi:hypothetical protein
MCRLMRIAERTSFRVILTSIWTIKLGVLCLFAKLKTIKVVMVMVMIDRCKIRSGTMFRIMRETPKRRGKGGT